MIYFDNASTTYPKPKEVLEAFNSYYTTCGANIGRSSHNASKDAGEMLFEVRKKVARLMGVKNPMRVVWCFNCTDALNLAIRGTVRQGWRVATTNYEHNSTIRVLRALEDEGVIELEIIDINNYQEALSEGVNLLVMGHASNVNGFVAPLAEIGAYCRNKGIITIVDAAQSAGVVPINITDMQIDMLAITGHKSLYGVQGTGALIISDFFNYKQIKPIKQGGTGSLSESTRQPDFLPDCFESGTLNVGGVIALGAAIDFVTKQGIESIVKHEKELANHFVTKCKELVSGFRVIGESSSTLAVVNFYIEGLEIGYIADRLADDYNICSRVGMQCAPMTHKSLGSYPDGGVRFSFGIFNTKEEVDIAINALITISNGRV